MKHKDFSKKTICLSCILLVIILGGTFYLGMAGGLANPEKESKTAYSEADSIRKQKAEKEIEVRQALYDYDKDNIVRAWVYLGDSEGEIAFVSILVVSNDEIIDTDAQDEIKAIAAGCLNLDAGNIDLICMDKETFFSGQKAGD